MFQGREGEHVGWALDQRHGRSALPTSIPPPAASEEPHPPSPLATIHTQGVCRAVAGALAERCP